MEYTELLDKADQCDDPYERWVARGWRAAAAAAQCGVVAGPAAGRGRVASGRGSQERSRRQLTMCHADLHPKGLHEQTCVMSALLCACRFAWLAAYCVSPFGAAERAWKPFNPILGETFELEIGNGVTYLAEQVRRMGRLDSGVLRWSKAGARRWAWAMAYLVKMSRCSQLFLRVSLGGMAGRGACRFSVMLGTQPVLRR